MRSIARVIATSGFWMLAAGCASPHPPARPATAIASSNDTAPTPRGEMPRRCALQLKIVDSTLASTASRATPETVAELGRLVDEYRALGNSCSPAAVTACGQALEAMLAELGLLWAIDDHHHKGAPFAETVLGWHREFFPDAPYAGLIAYAHGTVIAQLTRCGCAGRGDDPSRWRDAARAFQRAHALGKSDAVRIRWDGRELSLPEAAEQAAVLADSYASQAEIQRTAAGVRRWPAQIPFDAIKLARAPRSE